MACKCGRCRCDEPPERDADGLLRNADGELVCPICHVALPHTSGTAGPCTAEAKRRLKERR